MLEVKVNVPEIKSFINEIAEVPGKIFSIVRYNVKESVSNYLNDLMKMELTLFLGPKRYEHQNEKGSNYRNGSYFRKFTIKGIGEIDVKIPRDRQGQFNTQVMPKSIQYEDRIREDMGLMFLTGVRY